MYEVRETDLLGRIGLLTTSSGKITTPALLPVIHPLRQEVTAEEIRKIGFDAVMTNAYIMYCRSKEHALANGVHSLLNFNGPIMTDSGGYQVLEYGDVEVSPFEISNFQRGIKSDICVILDSPTRPDATIDEAKATVKKTFVSAEESSEFYCSDQLWTGPIQGGPFLNLIRLSSFLMRHFPFGIFALGSPTQMMESYNFQTLMKMIQTAKKNLPLNAPLHLFGAGHPLTLPVAVALGCDMFDSASYMLYAKQQRYLTRRGTREISSIKYFECSCPVCSKFSPDELRQLDTDQFVKLLAKHNLHVIMEEISAIRQSISEGSLWEYVIHKAFCHPKLSKAWSSIEQTSLRFLDGTRVVKDTGAFATTILDYVRPEFVRFRLRMGRVNHSIKKIGTIVVLPFPEDTIWYRKREYVRIARQLRLLEKSRGFLFHSTLGLIPLEVADIYPASQVMSTNYNNTDQVEELLQNELEKFANSKVLLLDTQGNFPNLQQPNVLTLTRSSDLLHSLSPIHV